MVHTPRGDEATTDYSCDSFGAEDVIELCIIEARPGPLLHDGLTGQLFCEVRRVDVMHLYRQVWVQLVELGQEWRALIRIVSSDMDDFKILRAARGYKFREVVLKVRKGFLDLIRLEIHILYVDN